MGNEAHKDVLERLISEAGRIAPSISSFAKAKNYRKVTDEALDTQNFLRWEVARTGRRIARGIGRSEPVPFIAMPHDDSHAWFSFSVSPFARSDEPVMVAVLEASIVRKINDLEAGLAAFAAVFSGSQATG